MATIEPEPLPPEEAIEAFRRKGFALSFDYRDVAREQHARAFTVAKVASLEILQDIRGAVDQALAEGRTFQDFKKDLKPVLQQKGWWGRTEMTDPKTGEVRTVQLGSTRRLEIIYDTNLRTSYSAGEWQQIQRLKARAPYLRYTAVMDSRTREQHKLYHSTVRPVDDPIWNHIYPPNGFRCRCAVEQLSERDLKRYGHQVTPPVQPLTRQHRNARTGEVLEVAEGVHPAFAYNPGKAALPVADPARYTAAALGHEAARASVRSRDFERLLSGELSGALPVGYLDAELAERIGANVRRVDLSSDTAAKQRRSHPDLAPEHYHHLPEMFEKGTVLTQGDMKLVFFRERGTDRWFKAVVKATGDGKAAFLVSFQRTHERELKRMQGAGDVVRQGE